MGYPCNDAKFHFNGKTYNETEFRKVLSSLDLKTASKYFDGLSVIPDMPFKKSWQEIAFKRALKWATENGFNKIAWTTGEQQNERYDLSKQVDRIEVSRTRPLSPYLELYLPKDSTSIKISFDKETGNITSASRDEFKDKPLDEVIGKDLADKILAGNKEFETLSGDDLKIGGSGMKGFYDKILPSFVNKYVKKWGGRVGEAKIKTDENNFALYRNGRKIGSYSTENEAQKQINRYPEIQAKEFQITRVDRTAMTVHSVEITPQMRESVAQGQTLFSIIGKPNSKARAEFDTQSKVIENEIKRYNEFPLESLLKKPFEIVHNDKEGVIDFNTIGGAILSKVIKETTKQDATFAGAYTNKNLTQILIDGAVKIQRQFKDAGRFKSAEQVGKVIKALTDAQNSGKPDAAMVIKDERAPLVRKYAKQEELSHQALGRSGIREKLVDLPVQVDKKFEKPIKRDYTNASLTSQQDELYAKHFRDDATEYFDATQEEIDNNLKNLIRVVIEAEADADIETFIENIKNVSPKGKEIAEYATNKLNEYVKTDDSGGKREGGGSTKSDEEGRRLRIRQGDETTTGNTDQFTQLRPREDSATNLIEKLNKLGELTPSENKYLEKRGNIKIEPFRDEIQFAKFNAKSATDLVKKALDKLDKDTVLDAISTFKSLKATADLSATGRQGWILGLTHPRIAFRSFVKQLKSLNQKQYEKFKQDLNLHPTIELAEASDLYLSVLADGSKINEREEAFMSRLLADDVYFKNKKAETVRRGLTYPIRKAEDAYKTYLDNLRIESFSLIAKQAHERLVRQGETDNAKYEAEMKGVAKFINYATGRGEWGSPTLNATFFSTRYWESRIQLINPVFYRKLPPNSRFLALKNMAGFVGATALLMLLWKLGGGEVGFKDPNDPNTLKLKWGNYSFDISAGIVSHLRYFARLVQIPFTNPKRGSKLDTAKYQTERYVRGKLSPVAGATWNVAEGKNFIGEPTSLKEEVLGKDGLIPGVDPFFGGGLTSPIQLNNFYDAAKADGSLGLIMMLPEFVGFGTTRYKTRVELVKERDAEQAKMSSAKTVTDRKEVKRRVDLWNNLIRRYDKYTPKK